MKDPISFDYPRQKWFYELGSRKSTGFPSRIECAKAYTRELVRRDPKYKVMLQGKTWTEVFRLLGIKMEAGA